MKKHIAALVFIIVLMLNCSEKKTQVIPEQIESTEQLKKKIYETGNETAFTDLILRTGNSQYPYEILPYALIMANKYNNGEGCHQILLSILSLNSAKVHGNDLSVINNLSKTEKEFVISYLLKGATLKNINCILTLEEMYKNGWGVEKNLEKSKEFSDKYDTIK